MGQPSFIQCQTLNDRARFFPSAGMSNKFSAVAGFSGEMAARFSVAYCSFTGISLFPF
jgi:hypothetical protein